MKLTILGIIVTTSLTISIYQTFCFKGQFVCTYIEYVNSVAIKSNMLSQELFTLQKYNFI